VHAVAVAESEPDPERQPESDPLGQTDSHDSPDGDGDPCSVDRSADRQSECLSERAANRSVDRYFCREHRRGTAGKQLS
jgi:hypothetical protein